MTKRKTWMSKVMVFILALAVVFTYSVMPMNQAYAAAKSKKPAKVSGLKAEALSSSSVKLTWKKAKNAKKYQIYVSTSKKKGYKRVATVKSSKKTYTVKKFNKKALKANKKYYFKVRAVNGKKYGKFSKIISKKTLKKENIVEKPATEGEAKARTMTIEIDMTDEARYPKGHKVEVWVPVPSSEPYQVISNYDLKADGAVASEFTVENNSGWSNQMAHFVWDENAEPADRKATVKFDAERKAVSRPDPQEDASATIPADAQKFITLESSAIDLDNAYVQKYAKIAAGDATTTLGKAENIYNWVIDNLERFDIGDKFTGKDGAEVEFFNATGCGEGNPGNLLERFEKYGRWGGHCTDLNSCFVALCRANGIAAREMFGIRLNDTSSDGQHCWAEFYLPGEGWTFADPGDVLKQARSVAADRSKEAIEAARKDQSVLDKKKALWCGVDNNRIVLSRGRDLVLEPAQKGDARNTFGYPYAEVDGVQKDAAGNDIDCTKYKDFKYTITCTEVVDRQVFVDADYVKSLVDSGASNVVIAEVSWGDMDYAPDYMIEGAIHVNTDDLESNYPDLGYEFWDLRGFNNNYKELIAALESYGITTDTELICYGADPAGSAQTRLAMAALMMGVKKVRVLDGGVAAWGDKGYPMVKKSEAAVPTPASFGRTEPLHPEWVISTADMLKKVESDSNFKLVSIRSYDEFCGKTSGYAYIDIAGEPKGAIWGHDTDDGSYFANGKTVDTDKIDEYLAPYGASTKNELAFYCGTGWRATIPFLICYEEGIDNMKLWDDGWYVYSGAYSDPWNYGDGTAKGEDFNSHPVQIGDPAKGAVKETTVKALWDADEYFNPLRGLSANQEELTARFTGSYYDVFNIMPPKENIQKSVKFSSSDPSVATVNEDGTVQVLDASAEKTVTIKAEANANDKEASFTLKIVPGTQIISAEELNRAIEAEEFAGGSFKVLDTRKAEDFAAGHIKTAVSADVSAIAANSEPTDEQKAEAKTNVENAINGDDGLKYVLICYSGNKYANTAKDILTNELGVAPENVFILGQDDFTQGSDGGMKAWNAKEFPLEK